MASLYSYSFNTLISSSPLSIAVRSRSATHKLYCSSQSLQPALLSRKARASPKLARHSGHYDGQWSSPKDLICGQYLMRRYLKSCAVFVGQPVRYLHKGCPQLVPRRPSDRGGGEDQEEESSPRNADSTKAPLLMQGLPMIVWPSLLLAFKNWTLTKFIINPYFDKDFNMTDFLRGAKQALVYVSSHLAQGNFDALEGLVAFSALQEIKKNHALLNMRQRQELQITEQEVYFCAPYQIGIIMDDSTNQRYAEITVIYHCLRGIDDIRLKDPSLTELAKYTDHITICNYRFIREYTKGVQGEWIVNALNHFKLSQIQ